MADPDWLRARALTTLTGTVNNRSGPFAVDLTDEEKGRLTVGFSPEKRTPATTVDRRGGARALQTSSGEGKDGYRCGAHWGSRWSSQRARGNSPASARLSSCGVRGKASSDELPSSIRCEGEMHEGSGRGFVPSRREGAKLRLRKLTVVAGIQRNLAAAWTNSGERY